MQIDVHQHIWTEPLLDALAVRDSLPFVRSSDGVPREDASELIGAHLDGVQSLGAEFAAWGPVALDEADSENVDTLIARGCVGVSLPAAALAAPDSLEAIAPLLQRIATRCVPLLVHPGPAPGSVLRQASLGEPLWWPALTDYVAQMQAAWLTFASLGRREHPELVVVFAMLAGGVPLLSERLAARGGPSIDLRDPYVFYDTSNYGPAAVEAMGCRVGSEQPVYGSDRPVVEPLRTGREHLLQANGARILAPIRTAA